jgi:CRP-like cAMP-binding protein
MSLCDSGSSRGVGMSSFFGAKRNSLLAALASANSERWLAQFEAVEMPLGQVLHEPGDRITQVYFPTTAVISLLGVLDNKDSSWLAVIGNEGMVGASLFAGKASTPYRAVVHCAGHGFRVKAQALKEEEKRGDSVLPLALRFTQALMTQIAQTALCNRHHLLDQQLCRWLLLNLDQQRSSELSMTQALIAATLGVRRESVTQSAFKLQEAGLISYSRGRIVLLNRKGLEARACECYALVKREYARLQPVAGDSRISAL